MFQTCDPGAGPVLTPEDFKSFSPLFLYFKLVTTGAEQISTPGASYEQSW